MKLQRMQGLLCNLETKAKAFLKTCYEHADSSEKEHAFRWAPLHNKKTKNKGGPTNIRSPRCFRRAWPFPNRVLLFVLLPPPHLFLPSAAPSPARSPLSPLLALACHFLLLAPCSIKLPSKSATYMLPWSRGGRSNCGQRRCESVMQSASDVAHKVW